MGQSPEFIEYSDRMNKLHKDELNGIVHLTAGEEQVKADNELHAAFFIFLIILGITFPPLGIFLIWCFITDDNGAIKVSTTDER